MYWESKKYLLVKIKILRFKKKNKIKKKKKSLLF